LRTLLLPLRFLELSGLLGWVRRLVPLAGMLPPLRSWAPAGEIVRAFGDERQRVGLLAGCVAQVMFAETNRAATRVLARNGCTVVAPRQQGCCGALYLHAGKRAAAQDCARRNIDAFDENLQVVVVTAAGCGAAMKEYGALLADDPVYAERARALASRVRDITELLDTLPLQPPPAATTCKVTYHDACHLAHGQGVREAPRRLLRKIPGLELVELPQSDLCCGSAGSYNLTEPAMAQRLNPVDAGRDRRGCQSGLRHADPSGPGARRGAHRGSPSGRAARSRLHPRLIPVRAQVRRR
jgi:glycolate oxidase iron-sulfur subunit